MVEIALACTYCGEILAKETDDNGVFSSDEIHGCFGERPGFIGDIRSTGIYIVEDVEIVTPNT